MPRGMAERRTTGDSRRIQVLVADDDEFVRTLLQRKLEEADFDVILAADGRECLNRVSAEVSVALVDLNMPELGGMDCLQAIRRKCADTQVIIITASEEISDAVEAMRRGAFDYVTKPFNSGALTALVEKAAYSAGLTRENRQLRQAIGISRPHRPFVGSSPAICSLIRKAERVAALDATVLLTGESGVGKGLLARIIHYQGPRADRPMVMVNCAAFPRDLVEAELFGHERGAFTGANEKRLGRVEIADGGTIFLDEVGDMPLELQPKLLTFLQDRTFQRVGGNDTIRVDVRVIAATHEDLHAMCGEGRFREDLYFRLNVLPLHIPALRSRPEDIPELAESLLRRISEQRGCMPLQLADDALEVLLQYSWPGNVRELDNVLERASAFCTGDTIKREDLPAEICGDGKTDGPANGVLAGRPLKEVERMAIEQTLDYCNGNKAQAARVLEISGKSIYNKMRRLGLL